MLSKLTTPKEQAAMVCIAAAIVIGAMAIYVREGQDAAVPDSVPETIEILSKPSPIEDLGSAPADPTRAIPLKPIVPEETLKAKEFVVSIAGAVEEPGVYRLDTEARIEDLINRAGGLAEGADLRDINRAARLIDGTTLTIPFGPSVRIDGDSLVGEQRSGNAVLNPPQYTMRGWQLDASKNLAQSGPSATTQEVEVEKVGAGEDLVDVNHATVDELRTLPNIGPALARRIFDYVKDHPIRSVEELDNVNGIGEKRLNSIRDKIVIR